MKISVIGDLIEDIYIYGDVHRISPEAPVPIFKVKEQKTSLGGAANVFANLKNLTDSVDLCTKNLNGIIQKTRYISNGHYMFRADSEDLENITWSHNPSYKQADLVIVSDYNKGSITNFSSLEISNKCIVDPKKPLHEYRGCWCIKPNKKEFELSEGFWKNDSELEQLMYTCIIKNEFDHLIVTLGEMGVAYMDRKSLTFNRIKSTIVDVYDVTGAGDTFISVLAYGLSINMSMIDSIILANKAAGISVSKHGTYKITKSDLNLSNKTVFTNGCFDVLHRGHIEYLKQSKTLGDRLVVGLNSDSSVKKLKGKHRPVNNETDRKYMLENLPFVDEVIIFDEDSPYDLIKKVSPDVITKGGDYTVDSVVGNDLAKVVIIPYVSGYSTTSILERNSWEKVNR
jgi:D-beta-D-heptose 7-phosphate kinase/D-beta-D-heptose 1-phosphate adenosyltransferase